MGPLDEVIGESPALLALKRRIRSLLEGQGARRRLPPILVQGETGTGKGLVARVIHRAGPRAAGPFVDVNCAAIPESLLEAELFGCERGAFTDARRSKPGLFQAADGGTLFLDEIGLVPLGLQAKLLSALETRTVRRLGSTRSDPVDVSIVAATNDDLPASVREGRFRQDLYHRLAVVTLELPPLRQRRGDVERLAEHLLARVCADYGMAPRTLSPDARAALRAHPWPGNVRELGNVIERAALLSPARTLTAAALDLADAGPAPAGDPAPGASERDRLAARSSPPGGTSRGRRRGSGSRGTPSAQASAATAWRRPTASGGTAPARPAAGWSPARSPPRLRPPVSPWEACAGAAAASCSCASGRRGRRTPGRPRRAVCSTAASRRSTRSAGAWKRWGAAGSWRRSGRKPPRTRRDAPRTSPSRSGTPWSAAGPPGTFRPTWR